MKVLSELWLNGNSILDLGDSNDFSSATNLQRAKVEANRALALAVTGPSIKAIAGSELDLDGEETVDGVVLTDGDLVFCGSQATDPLENGFWLVNTTGAWVRPNFSEDTAVVPKFSTYYISDGSYQGKLFFVYNAGNPANDIIVGTHSITGDILPFGGGTELTSGDGISIVGGVASILLGVGSLLQFVGGELSIDKTKVSQKYTYENSEVNGATLAVTHNLNNSYPIVQVWMYDDVEEKWRTVLCEVESTSANAVLLIFSSDLSAAMLKVIVSG